MASDPKNPKAGELSIDASAVAPFAVEIDDAIGLRTAHPGTDEALTEISVNQADWGVKAGVAQADVDELAASTQRIATCDLFLLAVLRLAKILRNTRAMEVHNREVRIGVIADTVEGRGKLPGNEEVAAKYSKTRSYRSTVGAKSAKTRKRNQKAEQAEAEQHASEAEAAKTAGSTAGAPAATATTAANGATTH